MDNVYEKVCPGCGRSAPLAAKFCSGCGHEYRTVFHDQPAPTESSPPTSSTPEASNFDARWAPVVAIVPVLVVFAFFNAPKQEVRVVSQAAQAQVSANAGAPPSEVVPEYGQTPYQVNLTMGKPEYTEHGNYDQSQDWYYSRNGRTLKVHFNGNGLVDDWTTY